MWTSLRQTKTKMINGTSTNKLHFTSESDTIRYDRRV